MSERVFEGAVTLRQMPLRGMITLKGDLKSAQVKEAAVVATDVAFPKRGTANCSREHGVAWMAPDELLILCPHGEVDKELARMRAALSGVHHLLQDVSDARVIFRLEGSEMRDVLAKVCPVDLRPAAFDVGKFRRTRIAQVPCAFWFRGADWAELIAFRSVQDYVWSVLANAASSDARVGHFS
ncbi:MAG: sarcosine oxidase subunit gamma family protein [Pseudomonadota bacterium]